MPHNHIPDPLSVAIARAKHLEEVLSGFKEQEGEKFENFLVPLVG